MKRKRNTDQEDDKEHEEEDEDKKTVTYDYGGANQETQDRWISRRNTICRRYSTRKLSREDQWIANDWYWKLDSKWNTIDLNHTMDVACGCSSQRILLSLLSKISKDDSISPTQSIHLLQGLVFEWWKEKDLYKILIQPVVHAFLSMWCRRFLPLDSPFDRGVYQLFHELNEIEPDVTTFVETLGAIINGYESKQSCVVIDDSKLFSLLPMDRLSLLLATNGVRIGVDDVISFGSAKNGRDYQRIQLMFPYIFLRIKVVQCQPDESFNLVWM
jgi:hypothetical protein